MAYSLWCGDGTIGDTVHATLPESLTYNGNPGKIIIAINVSVSALLPWFTSSINYQLLIHFLNGYQLTLRRCCCLDMEQ